MESIDDILARHGLDGPESPRNGRRVDADRRSSRQGSADVDFDALLASARFNGAPRRRRARPDDEADPIGPSDPEPRTRRAQPENASGPSSRRARHDTGANRVGRPTAEPPVRRARHDSGEFRTRDPRDSEPPPRRSRHDTGGNPIDPPPADEPRRRRARNDSGEFRARQRHDQPDDNRPAAPQPPARRARNDSGEFRARQHHDHPDDDRPGAPERPARRARHDSGEFRTRGPEWAADVAGPPAGRSRSATPVDRERTSGSTPLSRPEDARRSRHDAPAANTTAIRLDSVSRGTPADSEPARRRSSTTGRNRRALREPVVEAGQRERNGTAADDHHATTAVPVEPRARRRALAEDAPAATERVTRRAPGEEPPTTAAGRRAVRAQADEQPATTALPAGGRRNRHAGQQDPQAAAGTGRRASRASADEHPATTALPLAERRTRSEPPAEEPATTAVPANGRPRRVPVDDPPATTAIATSAAVEGRSRGQDSSETAFATSAARRSQRGVADQTTTALRGVTPRRGTKASEEPPDQPMTTALRASSEQATTRVRAVDRPEIGSREHRIDETLTRITAAHAGMALAVKDGKEPKQEAVKRSRVGRLLVLAMSVLVLGATTFGYGTKTWLGSSVRTVTALDLGSGAIVDAAVQQGDTNVLVVATDPAAATDPAKGPGAGTVVVAHVPEGGGSVTALSIPTDLEINRPPCERYDPKTATYTDETLRAEARTRLSSAFEAGGPRCAVRVVQQLTGLAITKFVGVDLGRVGAAVDAVGGVEVCVPRPVVDAALGPVVPEAGKRRLDGNRAGDFVRAADVDDDQPSGRVERQQQVLAAVLDAALAGIGPLEVTKVAALRKALDGAIITDKAGIDEVQALALSLRKLDAPGVTFAAVPTAPETNGRGNSVIRDTDAAALFGALRKDAKLPAGADARAAGQGLSPADVKVEVINGSTRSGLAGKVGDTLKSLGFSVSDVANAKQPTPQTLIRFSPDQAAAAGLLASTVPAAQQVPNPGATGVLQLVLGRTFDDVVRAPVALRAESPAPAAPTAVSCA